MVVVILESIGMSSSPTDRRTHTDLVPAALLVHAILHGSGKGVLRLPIYGGGGGSGEANLYSRDLHGARAAWVVPRASSGVEHGRAKVARSANAGP
jgi:hypothetical protein